jgi:hypothetical protein
MPERFGADGGGGHGLSHLVIHKRPDKLTLFRISHFYTLTVPRMHGSLIGYKFSVIYKSHDQHGVAMSRHVTAPKNNELGTIASYIKG